MGDEKLRLEWQDGGPFWEAVIPGHAELSVWKKSLEWIAETADGRAFSGSKGKPADSLLAAQLAAEAAALMWLSKGVAAFGGRVLTAKQVALVAEALNAWGRYGGDPTLQQARDADVLTRELEGGGT